MYYVILYYKICSVEYPEREVKAQLKLCQALGLKGRVLIGDHGINGTLGGSKEALEKYIAYINEHPIFSGIDFKLSESESEPFPRLRIVARDEIITTGVKEKIDFSQRGQHVDRDTFQQWLENGEDMILLDLRNDYEWEVGRFRNAVRPPLKYFRDLAETAEFYGQFKGKKIVMYCTGGIRCEPASAFLMSEVLGKENVYQLDGGIVKYAEKYGDSGYFEGKCYVFDNRITVDVNKSETAVVVGRCYHCQGASDIFRNCKNRFCNRHFIACDLCNLNNQNCCSVECIEVVKNGVNVRPPHTNDLKVPHRNK